MKKASKSNRWHDLLNKAYQKTEGSIVELAKVLGVPRLTARTWLRRGESRPRNAEELIEKLIAFIDAPKISGPNKLTRQRMWQSMRCLQNFTADNIVATADVGLSSAQKFIKALLNANYVAVCEKKGFRVTYRLIRDTGPHAPEIGRNRDFVFDVNLKSFAWRKESAVAA
ncbi:MAG: hypothetical protein AB1403_00530 [Candidatus Riflebacteria bacterium]